MATPANVAPSGGSGMVAAIEARLGRGNAPGLPMIRGAGVSWSIRSLPRMTTSRNSTDDGLVWVRLIVAAVAMAASAQAARTMRRLRRRSMVE